MKNETLKTAAISAIAGFLCVSSAVFAAPVSHVAASCNSKNISSKSSAREVEAKLEQTDSQIAQLDQQISDGLAELMHLQNQQFSDSANSSNYDEAILGQRHKIDAIEQKLSEQLSQETTLKALLKDSSDGHSARITAASATLTEINQVQAN